jgi:hypothetical protein
MGWASAGDIFNDVAQGLIDSNAPDDVKGGVLTRLIGALQADDWDTEDESLEHFQEDPVIVKAFADNGITLDRDD